LLKCIIRLNVRICECEALINRLESKLLEKEIEIWKHLIYNDRKHLYAD
jgi:hypothetical protein